MPAVYGKILQVVSGHAAGRLLAGGGTRHKTRSLVPLMVRFHCFLEILNVKKRLSFLPQQILGLHGSNCFLVYKTVQFIW